MIYSSSPCSLGIMAQSVDFARILMLGMSLDNLRVCRACPKLDNNCSAKKTDKIPDWCAKKLINLEQVPLTLRCGFAVAILLP